MKYQQQFYLPVLIRDSNASDSSPAVLQLLPSSSKPKTTK